MVRLSSLVFISFTSRVAVAIVSPETTTACKAIEALLPANVVYQTGSTAKRYKAERTNYWSVALQEDAPACIVLPTSAEQVSTVVKTLNINKGVKFAVKSGGHDPNPGQSSINEGILIALSHLNGTTNDPEKKVAYVKPGGHWTDVIAPLDQQGVTVVGGRLGLVGIGGYLAQGGLSFLSAQYGMACDNIVQYEVVKADGSIVNITPESDHNLVVAMRGAGHMFGIITKYTLRTFPIGRVWGGYRIYAGSSRGDQIFAAFHEFLKNPDADPKAALIVNTSYLTQGTLSYMVFFFYDGPKPPPGAFGPIFDIPSTLDLTAERTYTELLVFNARGVDLLGSRSSFRSITLPFVESDPGWYGEIRTQYLNITSAYLKNHYIPFSTVAMQAFPGSIGKQTALRGGNAMGLTANDKTRFILEINTLWRDKKEDAKIYDMAKQLTDGILKKVDNLRQNSGGKIETYLPYFMNDAAYDQDVFGSYKDADKYRRLQQASDPTGFWKRSGGFQIDGSH